MAEHQPLQPACNLVLWDLPEGVQHEICCLLGSADKTALRATCHAAKVLVDRYLKQATFVGVPHVSAAHLPSSIQHAVMHTSGPTRSSWLLHSLQHVSQLRSLHVSAMNAMETMPVKEGKRPMKAQELPGLLAGLPELLSRASPGGHLTQLTLMGIGSSLRKVREKDMQAMLSRLKRYQQPGYLLKEFATPHGMNAFRSTFQTLGSCLHSLTHLYVECAHWHLLPHYATHHLSQLRNLSHLSFRAAEDLKVSHLAPLYLCTSLKSLDLCNAGLADPDEGPEDPMNTWALNSLDPSSRQVLQDICAENGWLPPNNRIHQARVLLKQLGRIPNLTALNVQALPLPADYNNDDTADVKLTELLSPLAPRLRRLDLSFQDVDPDVVHPTWFSEAMTQLTALTWLRFDQYELGGEGLQYEDNLLEELQEQVLPNLRYCELPYLPLSESNMSALMALTQVTSLNLPDPTDDADEYLPQLNKLLEKIGSNLIELDLSSWVVDPLHVATCCPNLISLNLSNTSVQGADLPVTFDNAIFSHLPQLQRFGCESTGFDDAAFISLLSQCPKLKELSASNCCVVGNRLVSALLAQAANSECCQQEEATVDVLPGMVEPSHDAGASATGASAREPTAATGSTANVTHSETATGCPANVTGSAANVTGSSSAHAASSTAAAESSRDGELGGSSSSADPMLAVDDRVVAEMGNAAGSSQLPMQTSTDGIGGHRGRWGPAGQPMNTRDLMLALRGRAPPSSPAVVPPSRLVAPVAPVAPIPRAEVHTSLELLQLDQQYAGPDDEKGGRLTDEGIQVIARLLPSLQQLSIATSLINVPGWVTLGLCCTQLTSLQVSSCAITDVHMWQMAQGDFSYEVLQKIKNMLPGVENNPHIKWKAPRDKMAFFPVLRDLEVSEDGLITPAGVDVLAQAVQNGRCAIRELRVAEGLNTDDEDDDDDDSDNDDDNDDQEVLSRASASSYETMSTSSVVAKALNNTVLDDAGSAPEEEDRRKKDNLHILRIMQACIRGGDTTEGQQQQQQGQSSGAQHSQMPQDGMQVSGGQAAATGGAGSGSNAYMKAAATGGAGSGSNTDMQAAAGKGSSENNTQATAVEGGPKSMGQDVGWGPGGNSAGEGRRGEGEGGDVGGPSSEGGSGLRSLGQLLGQHMMNLEAALHNVGSSVQVMVSNVAAACMSGPSTQGGAPNRSAAGGPGDDGSDSEETFSEGSSDGDSQWEEVQPGVDAGVDREAERKLALERRPRILHQPRLAGWLSQGLLVRDTMHMTEEEERARTWMEDPDLECDKADPWSSRYGVNAQE